MQVNRCLKKRSYNYKYKPGAEYDNKLPYGGKIVLAKRKLPDSWMVIGFQIVVLCIAVWLLYFACYRQASFHFYVMWISAQMGHSHAQHSVGQKYLQGGATEQDHAAAFYWFRKAADQGHPHASYNLAIGHLKGFKTDVQNSEVRQLINIAAKNGVLEAKPALEQLCQEIGDCIEETTKDQKD